MRKSLVHLLYADSLTYRNTDWKAVYPDSILHEITIPAGKEEDQAISIASSVMSLNPPPRVGDTVVVVPNEEAPLFEHTCIQVIQKRFEETVEVFITNGTNQPFKIPYVLTYKTKTPKDSPMVMYNYKDSCGSCGKC